MNTIQIKTNIKYQDQHLLCSGSIKYTEIYGYYEIQCPFNISTCINKPDKSLSSYVNNGTQCGIYSNYQQCQNECKEECLYHSENERQLMKQSIFIPNILYLNITTVHNILIGKIKDFIKDQE